MKFNQTTLSGRVAWKKEMSYTDSGKATIQIRLDNKRNDGKYDHFFITFFDNDKRALAKDVNEHVNAGDSILVNASLSTYEVNVQENKKHTRITLNGWGFKHVVFDKTSNTWKEAGKKPDNQSETD